MLLTYGIIGTVRHWGGSIAKIWPVVARFTLEEAQAYLKALEDQALTFKMWDNHMKKHNPRERWDELAEEYIERHMMDKHFEPDTAYDIMCFKEDSAQ
jgi:hypothetical protein